MPKIVLTDKKMNMLHSVWPELQSLGEIVVTDNDSADTLLEVVSDADLLVICYAQITRQTIQSASKLKAILKWGVGVDSIDIAAANEFGLPICHCPTYGTSTIADHAFGLLIALARKLIPLVNATRQDGWIWPESSRKWAGIDLEGKVVGLVGFGRIAQKMARRCAGFDMQVLAYDPSVKPEENTMDQVTLVDLETLLRQSDFVSVHAVLNEKNRYMIGDKELGWMKPSAYIINTARGALVNETSLFHALQKKIIAGAALDVFESEPLNKSHSFYSLDNVLITPHFAYYTDEADDRLDRECLYSATRILNNQKLVNVKNGDTLESMGKPINRYPYGYLPYSLEC